MLISLLLPPESHHGDGDLGQHSVVPVVPRAERSDASTWQGLTLHHLAAARLLANASESVSRPWDSRVAVPMPLCAALATQSDGYQRSHDVLEAGALPHMICFF